MKEKEYLEIAENIKKYRKLKGMTQEQMSFALGIDSQYYSQLEQGRRHFTLERILDCCRILDIRITDIVPEPESEDANTKEIVQRINKKLAGASCKQLLLTEHFIDSVLLYIL